MVNNYYDIEFFRVLTCQPEMIRQAVAHPLFDCIGHSYRIAYGNTALTLASSCDKELTFIPDPREFEYDYRWLSSDGTREIMKKFADRHFEKVYGVHPDRFEILP